MLKKVLFILIVLGLIVHQSIFLYGLDNGIADHFLKFWKSLGITQTEYSIFLFKNHIWFWLLPVISFSLMLMSVVFSKKSLAVFTALLTVVFDVSIYWSVYAPELMVKM